MPCRLVAPEVLAGAAPTGLHLVADKEDAVLVQHLFHGAEEAVGRHGETAHTLHRFGDHGGHVPGRAHVDGVPEVLHAGGRVGRVVVVGPGAAHPVAAVHEVDRQARQL